MSSFSAKLEHDYPMVKDLLKPRDSPIEFPDHYIIPDLVTDCPWDYKLNNDLEGIISPASEKWFLDIAKYDKANTTKFMGLKAGWLTAACYSIAPKKQMRMIADYLNYLFNIDDWMDDFDVNDTMGMRETCIGAMRDPIHFKTDKRAGLMTKSYFKTCREDAGEGTVTRFIRTMGEFFDAIVIQSDDRTKFVTPDLESYIDVRRDTSGCKPCFQLTEYAGQYDLPEVVVNHPLIQRMEQSTNDLVTWSNDMFSYNKEQIRGDTHNMISVAMDHYNYGLQEAVDFVGQMCSQAMKNFNADREKLPSFGPEIDDMVQKYGQGLQDWITGSLHWSFHTERYFGKHGPEVKIHRTVCLSAKAPLN